MGVLGEHVVLRFPTKFVKMVMTCVSSVLFSVLLNRRPTPKFNGAEGVRHGDPLSSFLFSLCMGYLSRGLAELTGNPVLRFYPKCKENKIAHLLFVDDLLLFCYGDMASIDLLMEAFIKILRASRLSANLDKCEIFLDGVREHTK